MSVSKYIEIVEMGTSDSGKTKVWHVRNKSREGVDDVPGVIKWHGGWRKYVFHSDYAFYDWECLRMIADFIEAATKEHLGNRV